jgi:hypothetical protein
MRTETLPGRIGLIASCTLASAASLAASPTPWLPPPGEYRVDTVGTTRYHSPVGTAERIEQLDGETGQTTVIESTSGAASPVVTRYPGKGPNRQCQGAGAPPLIPDGMACASKLAVAGDAASTQVQCHGQTLDIELRKLSDGVWEKRSRTLPAASPHALPPDAAAAMAPVLAKMEARAKVAPPEEAASLRRQISAIQGGGIGATDAPETEFVQRWTWRSSACTVKR